MKYAIQILEEQLENEKYYKKKANAENDLARHERSIARILHIEQALEKLTPKT